MAQGVSASFYHAGLGGQARAERQAAWKSGAVRVMVCTNAFGMGIDKPSLCVAAPLVGKRGNLQGYGLEGLVVEIAYAGRVAEGEIGLTGI